MMKQYLIWIPAIVLIIGGIASTSISQYQIGTLVENDVKQRETLVELTVKTAEMAVKIDNLEKE